MTPPEIKLPLRVGTLELREAQGHCVIDECKVKGGGLMSMQHTVRDFEEMSEQAWDGKKVVICGEHLKEVLTAVLRLPNE